MFRKTSHEQIGREEQANGRSRVAIPSDGDFSRISDDIPHPDAFDWTQVDYNTSNTAL